MQNQTASHKTTSNTTLHSNIDIMKKKHKRKHMIYVKITYLDWKKGNKDAYGW